MADVAVRFSESAGISSKVNLVFQKRLQNAQERYAERVRNAYADNIAQLLSRPLAPWEWWTNWFQYSTDFAQRCVLFWDTIRKRGNNFIAHELAGKPPVLHFKYETILDARHLEHPVNYALLKIIPPEGVITDPKRRPYFIIDPRAGHGPGIGGFKEDSEIGVALREGHPVYFVTFFPEPVPGQTLLDICAAEQEFVRKVRDLHPDSPKPVIVGNCQGGWAAMMLAASDPDLIGPLVINGAPLSYWGGAWSSGEGDNPMRYSGGLLGGSWLASFMADLGHGVFDGADLVQNFENLNPANTLWDKYYHLFANVDKEPPRFLEFERWWSGFYLVGKNEIEWMVQNLFVGNKIWTGKVEGLSGNPFDLREIKTPIILFASLGDNITPPQQALNWVADIYGSTDEIKTRGQVIVGLVHQDVGHLGIFVSGRVARKEHAQVVSVLKSIEVLPPGLYGMHIIEHVGHEGNVEYDVEFTEHTLEDVVARLNRFKREDERPFHLVAEVSELNQRAYETFVQPFVQLWSNEFSARLMRFFHPMRVQRWAFSDWNPWLAWLAPAADLVSQQRLQIAPDQPFRQIERMFSEYISASLDYYRDLRDAYTEAAFFHTYGTLPALVGRYTPREAGARVDDRERPEVQHALAAIAEGGYAAALSRAGYLLSRKGKPLPLARFQLKQELMKKYQDYLPDLSPDVRRRLRGQQEIICRYEPEKAMLALGQLLSDPDDRRRFLTLLSAIAKEANETSGLSAEQTATLKRIREVLSARAVSVTAA